MDRSLLSLLLLIVVVSSVSSSLVVLLSSTLSCLLRAFPSWDATSEILVRVYYEDTDLSGITYHANYLRWFERARSDLLRRLEIDQRGCRAKSMNCIGPILKGILNPRRNSRGDLP